MMKDKKTIFRLITVFLCLLPVILNLIYVFLFGVDVPFQDEWDIEVFCLKKYHSGER